MLIENAGYLQKRIQEFVQGGGPKIPRKPFMPDPGGCGD